LLADLWAPVIVRPRAFPPCEVFFPVEFLATDWPDRNWLRWLNLLVLARPTRPHQLMVSSAPVVVAAAEVEEVVVQMTSPPPPLTSMTFLLVVNSVKNKIKIISHHHKGDFTKKFLLA
jgi:hypothetical protein